MSDVFISYSRKDIAFAKLIRQSLQASDLEPWIDWERIPVGENWWREICQAIAEANVFMFIISRNSIGSPVCKDEINEALQNRKRIIPIIVDDLKPEAVREFAPDLPQINWVAFEQDHNFQLTENPEVVSDKPEDRLVALPKLPQFQDALAKLSQAIHTDWDWVKFHTALQVDALRWQNRDKNQDYLLRGDALQAAEQRVLASSGKDPAPSPLQVEFITSSRQQETFRQQEELRSQQEKLRLEQKARTRQRLASWAIGIGLVIAIILGTFGWTQRNQYLNESQIRATAQFVAEEQRNVAQARQLAAQAGNRLADRFDISLLLAVQSSQIKDTVEGRTSLASILQAHPELRRILYSDTNQNISELALSPDNRWLAAAGDEALITIWDKKSNQRLLNLTGHTGWISQLVFSTDGKYLISKDTNWLITFWSTSDWKPVKKLTDKSIYQVLPIPWDDQVYLTKDINGYISLRNLQTESIIKRLLVCTAAEMVTHVSVHPTRQIAAVTCGKASIQIWDLNTGKSISAVVALTLHSGSEIAFSPDGKYLAFSGQGGFSDFYAGSIWLWDIEKFPQQPDSLKYPMNHGNNCGLVQLAFSPNSESLASACGNTIRLWSVKSRASLGKPLTGHFSSVEDLVFSPDGTKIFSAGDEDRIYAWDIAIRTPLLMTNLSYENWPSEVKFTSREKDQILIDAGCGKIADKGNTCIAGAVSLTNFSQSGTPRQTYTGTFVEVTRLAVSAKGQRFATGHIDGKINLWDLNTAQILYPDLGAHPRKITGLDLSANGHWLASGGQEGWLNLWDLSQTPPKFFSLRANGNEKSYPEGVYELHITPDSQTLVEAGTYLVGKDNISKILVWNLTSKSITREIIYKKTTIVGGRTTFAISPDSKTLAVATYNLITLYDLNTGQEMPSPIKPVTSEITTLQFSPDGRWLVSGGSDKTITWWDTASMQPIAQFGSVEYSVFSLAVSPDGYTIANLGESRVIQIWNIHLQDWQNFACQIANRNLTPAEWQNYLPGIPYQKTCPENP